MTPAEVRATASDEVVLISTLYGEARGEPIAGLIGVACVIRNRSQHENPKRFGGTIKGVCLKPAQFSCWWEVSPNTRRVHDLAETLMAGAEPWAFGPAVVKELRWIARGILAREVRDHCYHADHYLTTALFQSERCPSWAQGKTPVAELGSHTFLRLG